MARNFFRTLGIGSNPMDGGISETNVQMMPQPNAQTYPGSHEQLMPGTNTQMYSGPQEQTIPTTGAQMYPGTNTQVYPGSQEQTIPATNPQMYPGTNSHLYPGPQEQTIPATNPQMYPGTNTQVYPGPQEQAIPATNPQMYPGTNSQLYPGPQEQTIPATNPQMYPVTNPQMNPGTNGQMMPGGYPHLRPGVTPQTMPAENIKMYTGSNEMITGTPIQPTAGANEQMMHGTHAQMMARTNEEKISETNQKTMPESYTQMVPEITDQIMAGINTQMIPGENIPAMPNSNIQVVVNDNSNVMYDQYPQELARPNMQSTEGINMQSMNTQLKQPHDSQMQFACADTQESNNNQHDLKSPNKADQKPQFNKETTEDYEPLTRVHSAYTPVGNRSKTSQILGVGCRLLWILYLLTAGLYLLTDGFREVTNVIFRTVGIKMIIVAVAFLIGAFYLAYKTIGRHCIPVVAVPQANYPYHHFNESYRQPRNHGLHNSITYGEQIALQQVPAKDRRDKSACPSHQQIVSSTNSNQHQIGSGLAQTGDQVILPKKVNQQLIPHDSASHSISPSGTQPCPLPNAADQQMANPLKHHDRQIVLTPNSSCQKGGSALYLKSPFCSRKVQTSTPSEHKVLNPSPSEEQESPPSHESSKLL